MTVNSLDGYPVYCRPDDGKYVLGRGKNGETLRVDNRYIVPYNSYLSKKFNAHINVEVSKHYVYKKFKKNFFMYKLINLNNDQTYFRL